jgi:hypothetical protein
VTAIPKPHDNFNNCCLILVVLFLPVLHKVSTLLISLPILPHAFTNGKADMTSTRLFSVKIVSYNSPFEVWNCSNIQVMWVAHIEGERKEVSLLFPCDLMLCMGFTVKYTFSIMLRGQPLSVEDKRQKKSYCLLKQHTLRRMGEGGLVQVHADFLFVTTEYRSIRTCIWTT